MNGATAHPGPPAESGQVTQRVETAGASSPGAPITRSVKGQFVKGAPSANPGGRTLGIAKYIRDQTRNGEELVDMLLECARGDLLVKRSRIMEDGRVVVAETYPCCRDRLDALKFLIERGLGNELASAPSEHAISVLASYTSTQLLAVFDRVRSAPVDAPALPDRTDDDPDGR